MTLSTATICLVPSGDVENGLLARLREWASVGLLDPFIWTTCAGWERDGELAIPVSGLLVSVGEEEEVDPLDVLARSEVDLRLVRLVLIQPVPGGPECGAEIRRTAVAGRAALDAKAPEGASVELTNVVIPVARGGHAPVDMLGGGYANLVVGVDDRSSDAGFATEVRAGLSHIGVAALNVATIAGMWRGIEHAPFDGADKEVVGHGQTAVAVVVRSFARVVEGGPLVDELASKLLQSQRSWPLPGEPGEFVLADAPEQVIATLAKRLIEREAAFRYAKFVPSDLPVKVRRGILQSFVDMFQFIFRGFREAPQVIFDRTVEKVIRKVEDTAQRLTYGAESSVLVRYAGRRRSDDAPPILSVSDLDREARTVLDLIDQVPLVGPVPGAWQALRSVCFSVIDGGEFPDDDPGPGGLRREVVTQAGLITPAVDHSVVSVPADLVGAAVDKDSDVVVAAVDPFGAKEARRRLHRQIARLLEQASTEGVAEESVVDSSSTERDPERLRQLIGDVEVAVGERRHTLLWRVGNAISENMEMASEELRRALETIRSPAPDPIDDDIAKARRKLLRIWLVSAALGVPLTAAIVVGWTSATIGTIVAVLAAVVVAGGWLSTWFVAFFNYQRQRFELQYNYRKGHARYGDAPRQLVHAAQGLARLTDVYVQFLDWAEIIGRAVTAPWGAIGGSPDVLPPPSSLEEETLPNAMRIGRARTTDLQQSRVAGRARAAVFRPGWLTSVYTTMKQREMDAFAFEAGTDEDDSPPDPDQDFPKVPSGARAHLRDRLRSGRAAEANVEVVLETIASFCREEAPAKIYSDVEPISREKEATRREPLDRYISRAFPPESGLAERLSPELFSGQAVKEKLHQVKRTIMWVPDLHLSAFRGAQVPDDTRQISVEAGSGRRYLLKTIRVDHSQALAPNALRPFGPVRADPSGNEDDRDATTDDEPGDDDDLPPV